jgi:histone H3/H4
MSNSPEQSGAAGGAAAGVPGGEDDITIPRAAMNKMVKELCPNIRVANDARELILNCCTEFIHLLSSESNEICNNQQKKTINAEHVLMGKKY